MRALLCRTWTTLSSVIAATRSCGQATREPPGARRAMYSVLEMASKRSLASQMVLCQEHSLSASLCHLRHQRLIQSTVWACALTERTKGERLFHCGRSRLLEIDLSFRSREQKAHGHIQHMLSLSDCVSRVFVWPVWSRFAVESPLTEV